MGRPPKSFERINRIFPECIDKLDSETLSESERAERATMIENCMKVCKWFFQQNVGSNKGEMQMSANEMLEFYMKKVLENRADNGLLSDYSDNLLGYAAQLAQVVQAQAAVRQAEALEKLANCINVAGQVCVQSETVS